MSNSKITDNQLKKELAAGTSVPEIAAKYRLTPRGVRSCITKLHKKQTYKSYGQQQAEKLKEKTTINPNHVLQEMLECEKRKNQQLLQRIKHLEEQLANEI